MNNTKRFILYTYALFWSMVLVLAVFIILFGPHVWLFELGSAICSWSPTVIVLLMFRKLYPNWSVKEFYKNAFKQKLNVPLILMVTLIQTGIILLSALIVSFRQDVEFLSLWNLSVSSLLTGLLFTLIQGATGEETGWRGFLQPELEKKSGVIKSSILVGVVWSFWHTPLWFASGAVGMDLLIYIVTFIIGNICLSIIIGTSYHSCRNLFVPIWIHFMFNLLARPYLGDPIETRCYLVLFYILTACGFIVWHTVRMKRIGVNENQCLNQLSS